jgi:hypothetical protein
MYKCCVLTAIGKFHLTWSQVISEVSVKEKRPRRKSDQAVKMGRKAEDLESRRKIQLKPVVSGPERCANTGQTLTTQTYQGGLHG